MIDCSAVWDRLAAKMCPELLKQKQIAELENAA